MPLGTGSPSAADTLGAAGTAVPPGPAVPPDNVIAPLLNTPFPPALAGVVLLVVLLIGVAAGRAKGRFGLLLAGLVALAVAGYLLTALDGPPAADRPDRVIAFYTATVPLLIGFLVGWLCARGNWLLRLVVLVAGVLLLANFPYAAAGAATAELLADRG